MRASTPVIDTRSEATIDCHTGARAEEGSAFSTESEHAPFVARPAPRPAGSARGAKRSKGHRCDATLRPSADRGWAIEWASVFALGATTAAAVGELAHRALEAAAFSCILAGVQLLLVALVRGRERLRRAKGVPRQHATGA